MDAHYMKPDEDCMGNPTPGYWRCFETCSDGSVVIGAGQTEDEATIDATIKRNEHEVFLRLPSVERLKILLAGDLLSTASKEALKIIGNLVINIYENLKDEQCSDSRGKDDILRAAQLWQAGD